MALMMAVIILVLSGWGITHTEIVYRASFGLIDRGLANSIHRAANMPAAVFFLVHVFAGTKLALSERYLARKWLLNIILIAIGIGLLVAVLYMEYIAF